MAIDIFLSLTNEELIQYYNEIGDKLMNNIDYELSMGELFLMSAVSKRKLTHKTKYKRGLPSNGIRNIDKILV